MKNLIKVILVFAMISLVACGKKSEVKTNTESESTAVETKQKIKMVTTIFPEYDWVKNIIKGKEENFDVRMLMTSGIDLHNFQPSAKDIPHIRGSGEKRMMILSRTGKA